MTYMPNVHEICVKSWMFDMNSCCIVFWWCYIILDKRCSKKGSKGCQSETFSICGVCVGGVFMNPSIAQYNLIKVTLQPMSYTSKECAHQNLLLFQCFIKMLYLNDLHFTKWTLPAFPTMAIWSTTLQLGSNYKDKWEYLQEKGAEHALSNLCCNYKTW